MGRFGGGGGVIFNARGGLGEPMQGAGKVFNHTEAKTEMDFRVNMTIEVDQVGNGLAIHTPIPIQLTYQRGQWQGRCESPPVSTLVCDSLSEALVACAEQVAAEVQMAVIERPMILGRITPEDIPSNVFR